jgi:cytochrome b involved in lipid metabolism
LSEEVPFVRNTDVTITLEDFEALLKKGEKLVILDDLVLDIGRFMGEHPGGLFALEHNVGRDISKFFYGGYSLEN